VWDEYRHVLKRSNLCDYDGILKEGYRILSLPDVHELYVDEAQDSGLDDWNIYLMLPCSKFIVGDPDQSIYAFRGGHPEILTKFAKAEPGEFYRIFARLIPAESHVTGDFNHRGEVTVSDAKRALAERIDRALRPELVVDNTRDDKEPPRVANG
jgi:superfamily I DNA/RNA helicase